MHLSLEVYKRHYAIEFVIDAIEKNYTFFKDMKINNIFIFSKQEEGYQLFANAKEKLETRTLSGEEIFELGKSLYKELVKLNIIQESEELESSRREIRRRISNIDKASKIIIWVLWVLLIIPFILMFF